MAFAVRADGPAARRHDESQPGIQVPLPVAEKGSGLCLGHLRSASRRMFPWQKRKSRQDGDADARPDQYQQGQHVVDPFGALLTRSEDCAESISIGDAVAEQRPLLHRIPGDGAVLPSEGMVGLTDDAQRIHGQRLEIQVRLVAANAGDARR